MSLIEEVRVAQADRERLDDARRRAWHAALRDAIRGEVLRRVRMGAGSKVLVYAADQDPGGGCCGHVQAPEDMPQSRLHEAVRQVVRELGEGVHCDRCGPHSMVWVD